MFKERKKNIIPPVFEPVKKIIIKRRMQASNGLQFSHVFSVKFEEGECTV